MSFIKGQWYKCIDSTGSAGRLTSGKCYQVIDVPMKSPYAQDRIRVESDDGQIDTWWQSRFDASPVVGAPGTGMSAPTGYPTHAGSIYAAPGTRVNAQPAETFPSKPGQPPKCECGTQTEKKVFSTFSYFFCPTCKVEVDARGRKIEAKGGEPTAEPAPPPAADRPSKNHVADVFAAAVRDDVDNAYHRMLDNLNDDIMDAMIYGVPKKKP